MITRSGQKVPEDIRSYWGEMTGQESETHGATKASAFAPDGPVLDRLGLACPGEAPSSPRLEGLKL